MDSEPGNDTQHKAHDAGFVLHNEVKEALRQTITRNEKQETGNGKHKNVS
jgi:hypothetical protein